MKPSGVKKAIKSTKKDSLGNVKRRLSLLLVLMGVLIVALIIAIVVVLNTRGGSDGTVEERNADGGVVITEETIEEYTKTSADITNAIQELGATDGAQILSGYKARASEVKNRVVSAMLRLDYLTMQANYDTNKEKGEEVITEILKVDEYLKNSTSAAAVLNMADYYGDIELYAKYEQLLNTRQAAEGVDMNLETEG